MKKYKKPLAEIIEVQTEEYCIASNILSSLEDVERSVFAEEDELG